ncbi:HAD family hydrolase [Loktanella sp. IMCC34160]|uniref:HAD-IA family hydrolase n=1 Tax=Loktanella sp. IMCC34160 TaxID=2510646 RepID=UPI00101BA2A9|nr:HAD-IA family hydrolase [Loktanella sp. IMCC34160]RYG90310.1 HAD family hydrolase [Loktanella sp. IMCC34160]
MAAALVLDFGGVISRTLFETHDLSERALGLAPGTLTWRGPFDPDQDAPWRAMQAGEMTERDYWTLRMRDTGALVGEDWTEFAQFVGRVRGADPAAVIRPEALAAIEKARNAGRKLAILSNELDLFYGADFREKLPFLKDFDAIVDATYTGILKPDPRAYGLVTDALGVAPGDCVFVDDQLKNIRGAEAAGMTAVHFDVTNPAVSYASALRALDAA